MNETEADDPGDDQVDGHDEIQQPWHHEDQDARDQGDDGLQMGNSECEMHLQGLREGAIFEIIIEIRAR
jgi:hypothetical protein